MSTTTDLAPEAAQVVASRHTPRSQRLEVEVEVDVDCDPVRSARVISAHVNNSALSLAEARVGDVAVYPVPSADTAEGTSMILTLRLRDQSRWLDRLHQEEIVALVSRCARVRDSRRLP